MVKEHRDKTGLGSWYSRNLFSVAPSSRGNKTDFRSDATVTMYTTRKLEWVIFCLSIREVDTPRMSSDLVESNVTILNDVKTRM